MNELAILKEHKLRNTEPRNSILKLFIEKDHALSSAEVETGVGSDIDRVTVYRTLKTFVEKGILHTIPDEDDSIRYAICVHECHNVKHYHNHVHFKCTLCGLTQCLDNVFIPAISLPIGFSFIEASFIVQGNCKTCNSA